MNEAIMTEEKVAIDQLEELKSRSELAIRLGNLGTQVPSESFLCGGGAVSANGVVPTLATP
jgi:hypothetical protein